MVAVDFLDLVKLVCHAPAATQLRGSNQSSLNQVQAAQKAPLPLLLELEGVKAWRAQMQRVRITVIFLSVQIQLDAKTRVAKCGMLDGAEILRKLASSALVASFVIRPLPFQEKRNTKRMQGNQNITCPLFFLNPMMNLVMKMLVRPKL